MFDANERKAKMVEMRNNGCSYQEIGKEFNLSKQRIGQILKSNAKCTEKAKNEAVKQIFADIREEIQTALESNCEARRKRNESRKWNRINDNVTNTINGKISALREIGRFIDCLEVKYTKGGAE